MLYFSLVSQYYLPAKYMSNAIADNEACSLKTMNFRIRAMGMYGTYERAFLIFMPVGAAFG